MSSKRKRDPETENEPPHKKPKSQKELIIEKLQSNFTSFIDALNGQPNNATRIQDQVQSALDFLMRSFPSHFEQNLPHIVHLHQIYPLVLSRTQVDREIDSLRTQNVLFLFKFDSAVAGSRAETLICFADRFKEYVTNRSKSLSLAQRMVIDKFLNQILKEESHQQSIEKFRLLTHHRLNESQISVLVQNGLLAIKDSSKFWFAIPGMGEFRRQLVESRKSALEVLRRQAYKELNASQFFDYLNITKNKSFRAVNKIGPAYVICDLLGNELISKLDSPMGLTLRLN